MTELEVKAAEVEVQKTVLDAPFVKAWEKEQIDDLCVQEKKLALLWKFHRLMRNDDQMVAVFKQLQTVRASIVVLEKSDFLG